MPDWVFCLVFASSQGSCSTFLCCSRETSQGFFCPWGYLHTVAKSSGNPLPLKGLFSSFPKGFLPFLCCLIIFRWQEAETSLLLPGLHKEVKSLTHGYSLLPTDSFLHATTSQWETRLHCLSAPTPFPRRCYGWGAPQHSTGTILDEFFFLHCTVSAWGQFIRQARSHRMLSEAGNSDDRQSLCHLPWLLANDVLFISRSAMKTLTPIRNMFNDKFSSFEIYRLMDEEAKTCC